MYNVYIIHCTLYNVHCALYSVQYHHAFTTYATLEKTNEYYEISLVYCEFGGI